MSFGSKLKQYRLEHGLSQEELAKKLNTTKQVISRYENEQRSPKLSVAVEYSKILGISLTYLVDDKCTDSKQSNKNDNSFHISNSALKFALFGGDKEITDEQLEEVKRFAKFVKERGKDE